MGIVANLVVALIAVLHVYIMILEMYFWDKPPGLKAFGLSQELASQTKVLAANQGLYNGFLAAGLFWGLSLGDQGKAVILFFLGCIFIAGVYGGLTAKRKILVIQAAPALVGLLLVGYAS